MSGLELAEKLWETKPSLKIITKSGYDYTFLAKAFQRLLAAVWI